MYCTKYHDFSDEELIVEAIVTRPNDDIVIELVERLRVLEAKSELFRKNGYEEDLMFEKNSRFNKLLGRF